MDQTAVQIRIPHDEHLEKLLVLLGDSNCMATSSHVNFTGNNLC